MRAAVMEQPGAPLEVRDDLELGSPPSARVSTHSPRVSRSC